MKFSIPRKYINKSSVLRYCKTSSLELNFSILWNGVNENMQYSIIIETGSSFKTATKPKIYLDEEKITKLIKEVFEKEFKKQEVNITKIISSNFALTMKKIRSLKQEVNDLKESIEFTQNDLGEKVADVEKKVSTFEIKMNELYDYQIDPDYVGISRQHIGDGGPISQKQHGRRWSN